MLFGLHELCEVVQAAKLRQLFHLVLNGEGEEDLAVAVVDFSC